MTKRQLSLFPLQPQRPEDISRQTPISATLVLFSEHLRQQGKSEHTLTAFLGDLNLLMEYSHAQTPISDYSTHKLNEFLHWMEVLRGVPCSRKTYARRVTTLKVYFKWLHEIGALNPDPAKLIVQRSGQAPLSEALTPEHIQACRYAAQAMRLKRSEESDTRPRFLFELLLQTGIKKSEADRLTLADFDTSNPQQASLMIQHPHQDVYKERRIALTDSLLAWLERYVAQYGLSDKLFTCTPRNLEYILTDLGTLAQISFKLSFEIMRWTSAVQDWRQGMEEDAIREKLGLSKISWYETGTKLRQLVQEQLEDEQDTE